MEQKDKKRAKEINFDVERVLGNYPKKFDISKCLNQDRTFPANFPDKVTPGLESTK